MPNWASVLREIQTCDGGLDRVRRKYLAKMHKMTGRNLITYYSGWLQKTGQFACSISDLDKNGFMNAVNGLDRKKGLDLFLHTPGGDFAATESIVDYLYQMFGTDIRCFIPQLSMSGGTMIACACKEIFMGKESNIGPIDPQYNGIPAHGVLAEFQEALESIKNDPASIPIWQTIIGKYHPTFIGECRNAISLASDIVEKWLLRGMLKGNTSASATARNIVTKLNNHADTKMHARHIHSDEAKKFGLKITMLEEDDKLQDIVLTIHHAYMHTFSASSSLKIVENHLGNAVVLNANNPR